MPTEGGASSVSGLGPPHTHRTAPAGKVLASHVEQTSRRQSCCRRSGFPNGGFHRSGGAQPSQRLATLLPTPPREPVRDSASSGNN